MAKQQALNEEWVDQVPEAVQEAADAYDEAHGKHQKSKEKLNTAKERVIERMKETGCPRVKIRNGEKWLVLHDHETVKIEKPQEHPAAAMNGDGNGHAGGHTVQTRRVRGGRVVKRTVPNKAAVTAGDANAEQSLEMFCQFGMTKKKMEAVAAACGGSTVGHFEVWMNGNLHWHNDLKGFGESWITKLQDAHLAFRQSFPVLTGEEPAEDGTIFDGDDEGDEE